MRAALQSCVESKIPCLLLEQISRRKNRRSKGAYSILQSGSAPHLGVHLRQAVLMQQHKLHPRYRLHMPAVRTHWLAQLHKLYYPSQSGNYHRCYSRFSICILCSVCRVNQLFQALSKKKSLTCFDNNCFHSLLFLPKSKI